MKTIPMATSNTLEPSMGLLSRLSEGDPQILAHPRRSSSMSPAGQAEQGPQGQQGRQRQDESGIGTAFHVFDVSAVPIVPVVPVLDLLARSAPARAGRY